MAIMTPKPTSRGTIPMVANRPRREANPFPVASASCLVASSTSKNALAHMLKTAVRPMAAMLVTVLTVLTDTVVIIS